jgi:hypothetical protein
MFAMDPRGLRYLVSVFRRVRRFEELCQILKDVRQVIDKFPVLEIVGRADVSILFNGPEPFPDDFLAVR